MKSDTPIGGFIELEFHKKKGTYHPNAIALANGRACLHLLLKTYKPAKVYVPYYSCEALLEPFILVNIPFEFYHVDLKMEPLFNKSLKKNEYFIYVNYFGIKNRAVSRLEKQYGKYLIVDNTQAFFNKKYQKANSFNSCRKFFGVPDGGYLYLQKRQQQQHYPPNVLYNATYLISRAEEKEGLYYSQFLENEKVLGAEIRGMSLISKKIMDSTDYDYCKHRRIENFLFLHENFKNYNQLMLDSLGTGIPHYYPLLPIKHIDKKELALKEKLFIPTLWPELILKNKKQPIESMLAKDILPLPIDQRYSLTEMKTIIKKLHKYL